MNDITIYHNNRCSKSRAGLQYLADKGIQAQVVKYMEEGIAPDELRQLLHKLGMQPQDLLRTKEELYREKYQAVQLSTDEWIAVMAANPRLIERPIVVRGDRAVLARPVERIEELF